jgi:hypothetical protein
MLLLQLVSPLQLTLFAVFLEFPEANNFQLAINDVTYAKIKVRAQENSPIRSKKNSTARE